MKAKERKGPKEEWFYLTKEDLSGMDVPTLEKSSHESTINLCI